MKLSPASKCLIKFICIAALAFMVIGCVVFRSIESLYFAIGVVLTSLLNVLKVFLLERTVQKTLEKEDPTFGRTYVLLQYLLRYVLTAVVLLGAGAISLYADPPFINIWGAIAGAFTLQISVMIVKYRKFDEET